MRVVDTLAIKCKRALEQTGFKRLVMAGGVSANRTLRAKLAEMMQKRGGKCSMPAGILHRQRRDDRLCRHGAAEERRQPGAERFGAAALAAGGTACGIKAKGG